MRWPQLGRGRRRDGQPAGESNTPPAGGSSVADGRASELPGQQPGQPGWSALPPIAPTWTAGAPLTTSSNDLLRPPLVLDRPPRRVSSRPLGSDDGTPDPGRVVGLASARPLPTTPIVAVPAQFPDQPPLRHATARPLSEHAPLTRATDAYVGEPLAPPAALAPPPTPTPLPAPAAPRRPEPQVEAMTDAGARFREALANLHNSGLPRYVSPSESGGVPEPAPAPPAIPAPVSWHAGQPPPPLPGDASGTDGPRLTHRRTLAESRRLGLGAPLRRDSDDGSGDGSGDDGDGPSDAEPSAVAETPAPPALMPPVDPPTPPAELPLVHPPAPRVEASPEPPPDEPPPPASAAPAQHSVDRPPHAHRAVIQPVVSARAIAAGSPRPSASAVPLVFRAHARTAVAEHFANRKPERAVVTRPAIVTPPAELVHALRTSHGIDVTDVAVHRDTSATVEARERRARAFARGGRVYLPEEAGPLNSAKARGLLAHELVHVAQQRRLGSSLPDESTDEGRALEEEARHAERLYSAETFADTELVHAPPAVSAHWVENRIVQLAGEAIDYFDPNSLMDSTRRAHFDQSAQTAVQQAMQQYRDSSGGATTFNSLSDEQLTERNFLEIINRELALLGEPPQAELSSRDRDAVKQLLERGGSGGGNSQTYRVETRREAHTAGGMFDNLFGSRGHTETHRWDEGQATGGAGGARPGGGGIGGTGTGSGTGTGTGSGGAMGTGSGTGGGMGGGAGQSFQYDREVRREAHTAGGMFDNLFGARGHTEHVTETTNADGSVTQTIGRQGSGQGGAGAGASHYQQQHDAHGGVDPHTGHLRTVEGTTAGRADVVADNLDLDQLATQLYDRLRSRLRREFLVDRERSGLLTDYR